jgi:death on curing protein
MISEADVLLLHEFSILDFGGSKELRDRNLLLAAIARPFQTFDGGELYQSPFEKAAALGESLVINHPFMDGNKRTAFLAMIALLKEYGIEFYVQENEVYDFIIAMSTGEKKFDAIVNWLKNKSS